MILDEAISALIGDIYEGPRNSSAWHRALNGLLDRTASRFLLVSAVDLKCHEYSMMCFHGPDDGRFLDGVSEYESDLYRTDPTLEYAARHPKVGFVSLTGAIADQGTEVSEHPYPRWTKEALGVGETIVRYTKPDDDLTLGISLHPPVSKGQHSTDEIRIFLMLFKHIEHSIRLSMRPPDFECSNEPQLLVDSSGLVRMTSNGARILLDQRDGLHIRRGRLYATRSDDTMRLNALIGQATRALSHGSSGGGLTIARPSGRRDWLVLASPLPKTYEPFATFAPAARVRIIDPDASKPMYCEYWLQMFGLTPTELRLAQALMAADGDLGTATEQLGLLPSTARVHLRHIFDKTGARGQAQLMRLLQRIEQ